MIENDELFKKKDNTLHRIIKYNLIKAVNLTTDIESFRKIMYFYSEALTFSIARSYYLIYCCEKDILEAPENNHYIS